MKCPKGGDTAKRERGSPPQMKCPPGEMSRRSGTEGGVFITLIICSLKIFYKINELF